MIVIKNQVKLGNWRIILVKIINNNDCDKKQVEFGRWTIILVKIIDNNDCDKK